MKKQNNSVSCRLKQAWVVLLLITLLLVASYALYYNSQTNTHHSERQSDGYHNSSLTHTLPKSRYTHLLQTPRIVTNRLQDLKREMESLQERAKQPSVTEKLFRNVIVANGDGKQHCNVSGIRSWQQGVVTSLQPEIEKNCQRLIDGDQREVYKVRKQVKEWRNAELYDQFVSRLSNCSVVHQEFSNIFYVSTEERNFPIAYTFVVYTNVRQVVRLLKSIYRPPNLYCIHPDARQGEEFAKVFHLISKCLDNVFVASKLEKVYYGHHSILDAQLNCMRDLMNYPATRWKYVINICGRELPLKTNREIVNSLENLNGTSVIGRNAHRVSSFIRWRRFVYKYALNLSGQMYKTHNRLGRPPYNITIFKSTTYLAASRPFVGFVLTSKKAISLRVYLRDVYAPEEHFYASLYVLPEAPRGHAINGDVKIPIVDLLIRQSHRHAREYAWEHCKGRTVHNVCIINFLDLPHIYEEFGLQPETQRPLFFFNKYFMEWDHTVMDCMEEWLVKVNMEEYKQDCIIQ